MGNIADVAKKAGVSPSTVARIINNRPGVRKETAALVKQAMLEIGYEPPPVTVRRGPKTKAREGVFTKNIAYLLIEMDEHLINSISNPGVMSKILTQYGMNLFYVPMAKADKLPDIISPYRIDGIIYQGNEPTNSALKDLKNMPVVRLMTRHSGEINFDCVAPDNIYMGERAAQFFSENKLKKVNYICSKPDYCAFKKRIDAFRHKCDELYIDLIDEAKFNFDATNQFDEAERVFLKTVESAKNEEIGIFILQSEYLLTICRQYWKLPESQQKKIKLLLGDPLPVTDDPCLKASVSYFDIKIDALNIRAIEQLLQRMRSGDFQIAPSDVFIRPVLHINTQK